MNPAGLKIGLLFEIFFFYNSCLVNCSVLIFRHTQINRQLALY